MALSKFKTEIIGISAEVAIADEYCIEIPSYYRARSNPDVVDRTRGVVKEAFEKYGISIPMKHVAEGQNPVDFILSDGKTLSVKSNQKGIGKDAPQNVGQPTADTYWRYFADFADAPVPIDYNGKAIMFKRVSLNRIDEVLNRYWVNMFDCDTFLHFYDFLDKTGCLTASPQFVAFSKRESPSWEKSGFSFTQSAATWNESNTVKYAGVSIGEFQVHNNRNCFKFRFNLDSIARLTEQGFI